MMIKITHDPFDQCKLDYNDINFLKRKIEDDDDSVWGLDSHSEDFIGLLLEAERSQMKRVKRAMKIVFRALILSQGCH